MCGRFALPGDVRETVETFSARPRDLDRWPSMLHPRFNICPTQPVLTIRLGEGGREAVGMRWGFLPHWYNSPTDGPLLINARAETIAEKPAFRDAARQRRCLIPAAGFYEWQGASKPKTPYFIAPTDGGVFAFAGVWQSWGSGDDAVETCAIVTCAANDMLSPIHHRMPVVIAPDDFGLWLGKEGKGAARLTRAAENDFFAFHEVGSAINSNRSEGAELIEHDPSAQPHQSKTQTIKRTARPNLEPDLFGSGEEP